MIIGNYKGCTSWWRSAAAARGLSACLTGCLTLGCLLTGPATAASAAQARPAASAHRHHHRKPAPPPPLDWTLRVPSIGVDAPVIRLGGPRSGIIAVPTFGQVEDVGWYRYGAVPGWPGNAVLLGHVDTYIGPAVFYDLYLLRPGAAIAVNRGGSHIAWYKVRWVKEVLKTAFPGHQVFGSTNQRHLWLITCGGQFDYYTRSYLSNIIVSAVSTYR
jgi:hypothetical protein